MSTTKKPAATAAEKPLYSFVVKDPVFNSALQVTVSQQAKHYLHQLADHMTDRGLQDDLYTLVTHIAGLQAALLELARDTEKLNVLTDPNIPSVLWTLEDVYNLLNCITVEFAN